MFYRTFTRTEVNEDMFSLYLSNDENIWGEFRRNLILKYNKFDSNKLMFKIDMKTSNSPHYLTQQYSKKSDLLVSQEIKGSLSVVILIKARSGKLISRGAFAEF